MPTAARVSSTIAGGNRTRLAPGRIPNQAINPTSTRNETLKSNNAAATAESGIARRGK